MKTDLELYYSPRKGIFEDSNGKQLSVEESKQAFYSGDYSNCNIAMLKVAELEWDMEKVNEYYGCSNSRS
jgi:hypothetical protein